MQATELRRHLRQEIQAALGDDLDTTLLYGSRARGDATPESDWDVLVLLRDSANRAKARAAMRALVGRIAEETNEHVSILPIKWSEAAENAGLLANVAREGIRL